MIQNTSLIIQRIFANTAADSEVDTRERNLIKLTSKLPQHNYMEDQTLMCSPISNYFLTSDLSNVMYKLSKVAKPLQKFLAF